MRVFPLDRQGGNEVEKRNRADCAEQKSADREDMSFESRQVHPWQKTN